MDLHTGRAGAKSYTCDIAGTDLWPGDWVTQEFTVRIDRVVPGARGGVRVVENPEYPDRDDDAANDTAAIVAKATGSATSSPPSRASASPSATATARVFLAARRSRPLTLWRPARHNVSGR
ncbi:hypothetical protein ACWDE0_04190 [Streptomyces sp. 900105755]